jgi:nitrate/nitrite-specific signal transduction histidine kinase
MKCPAVKKMFKRFNKNKRNFKIRDKIMVSFLAVALVAVGIISVFALRNMGVVGNTARLNSIRLGESAVAESVAALEDSGRRIIQLRAQSIAKDVELYILNNQSKGFESIVKSEDLKKIAIQTVGQTGSTMVYGTDGIIYFNNNPDLVGVNISVLAKGSSKYLDILENGYKGESAGYYDQEDENGNIRSRYVYCVPVKNTQLIVAANTYIDEFSRPAADTESRITAAVLNTTRYIDDQMNLAQWTFIVIIVCMLIIISILSSYVARSITEPIVALTKGSEVIAKGNLDYKIEVNTGDEIEHLATQFNSMTAALKESYSNLEQKVEERTKQLSQRAGQLYTINEISRKISSIINLEELLPFVANLLRQTFNYHNVNIFLFEPTSGRLILREICLSGYNGVIPLEVPLEMGEEGIVAWVAQSGEPIMANDVSKEPRHHYINELSDTRSELAIPVKIGDKILGVLDIESNELNAFTEDDMSTAQTLADQLAIAIENARLYKETGQIAVMEERNRMAREIHDTLAQGFTGIILQLEATEQALEKGNSQDTVSHLNKARSLARGSLSEARRSVWNLRPEALEKLRLPDAIKQEVVKFSQSSNIKASFDIEGTAHDLHPEQETTILRICQEALTNVRKHSKATEVKVQLNYDKSDLELVISDNGKGIVVNDDGTGSGGKHKGFGLISMRERARNAGGQFEVESEPDKGTTIKVTLPV